MLEIRNVTKVYHSKSGNDVRALDNVSVTFPETGMVFILGKSGSGKSTLLNVIGGLDGCDEGEFIIKGKSSKDFAGSDFDAYRNTFIGFIFQEYNILDDFTVGANIGLALELQGKKATNEQINAILGQVEMLDYAKRKPNELSGGQKQRIAIARALVKDPEIIMADEPTGALDSNTGKQIFDTLKELSKTKLVIIVSHDRDFAEIYGDRIIEMKDGKIDSDVTKHQVEAKAVSSGILQMSDSLLKIEKGYQFTAKDVELINAYLRDRDADVIVSGDARLNDNVRTAAGISADNTTSVFKDTDAEKDVKAKKYDGEKTRFIRSRLPMKNAVKMGASSLGHKKARLVFTIILSLVAFALFGFADTMGSYDKVVATTNSIIDSGIKNASFSLGVKETAWSEGKIQSTDYVDASFNDSDLSMLNSKLGVNFTPVYNGSSNINKTISLTDNMKSDMYIDPSTAYTGTLSGFVSMSADSLSALGFDIVGTLPANSGEIAISKFIYEQFKANGFKNSDKGEEVSADALTMEASGANSIIGKHLTMRVSMGEYTYKITAVIDTKFEYDRYSSFIPDTNAGAGSQQGGGDEPGVMDMVMMYELANTLKYGYHCLGYVIESDIKNMSTTMEKWYSEASMLGTSMNNWNVNISFDDYTHYIGRVGKSTLLSSVGKVTYFDSAKTSLGANEYLVPSYVFTSFIRGDYNAFSKLSSLYGSSSYFKNEGDLASIIRTIALYEYAEELLTDRRDYIAEQFLAYRGHEPASDTELISFLAEEYLYSNQDNDVKSAEEIIGAEFKVAVKEILGIDTAGYTNITDELAYNVLNETLANIYINGSEAMVYEYCFRTALARLYAYNAVYAPNASLHTDSNFINAFIFSKVSGYDQTAWDEMSVDTKISVSASAYANALINHPDISYGDMTYEDIKNEATALMLSASGGTLSEIAQSIKFQTSEWTENGEEKTTHSQYKLVGYFESDTKSDSLIISDTVYDDYIKVRDEQGYWYFEYAYHEDGIYSFAIAPMPTDKAQIRKFVELSYNESEDIGFLMQNQVMNSLEYFNDFIEIGAKIFIYVGLGFALFAALMMMNFISTSISYKRREIGILRAVGARSSDVFKIFFSEALIIAIINYVLSVIATVVAVTVLNNVVRGEGINVTLLSFGIRQVLLMLLISVFVAALASFLPVWNIARRKPVDAIKNT